jgi:hypothetical protein
MSPDPISPSFAEQTDTPKAVGSPNEAGSRESGRLAASDGTRRLSAELLAARDYSPALGLGEFNNEF